MARARFPGSWAVLLMAVCVLLCACSKRAADASRAGAAGGPAPAPEPNAEPPSPSTTARRVIRTAELWMETDAPDGAVSKLTMLADGRGGFVVSSETSQSRDSEGAETAVTTLVFRVPVETFDGALSAVRAMGTRVANEKVTGQDVTEEYVDLEARIRAQRALEEQYISILKGARSIPDVLAVQQKLGDVRTEIERAEGRRRYLESQTSLSTITVHVARHLDAVGAEGPGFARSISLAGHDAVAVGVTIVNGAIRAVGVLLPVGVLIAAPCWLLVRALRRRRSAHGAAA